MLSVIVIEIHSTYNGFFVVSDLCLKFYLEKDSHLIFFCNYHKDKIRDGINSCEFVNIVIYPRCFLDNEVNTHAINIDDIANKLQIKLKISLAYSSTKFIPWFILGQQLQR